MLEKLRQKYELIRKNRRILLTLAILGSIALLANGNYSTENSGSLLDSHDLPQTGNIQSEPGKNPPPSAHPNEYSTPATDGVFGTYTGLLYPYISPLAGFEDYECVTIVNGGYLFDALVSLGPNPNTRYDTKVAVLFPKDNPTASINIPVETDPATWDSRLNLINAGMALCGN